MVLVGHVVCHYSVLVMLEWMVQLVLGHVGIRSTLVHTINIIPSSHVLMPISQYLTPPEGAPPKINRIRIPHATCPAHAQ